MRSPTRHTRRVGVILVLPLLCGAAGAGDPVGAADAAPAMAPYVVGAFGGNWAGYATSGATDAFTSASAAWTVPTVTCKTKDDLYAPWVGIDGYVNKTVEQTGVATSCSSGAPASAAWYEFYPAGPVYFSKPISAGDSITASVTATVGASADAVTITISDTTKGWTKTVKRSVTALLATAEAVIESPPSAYPASPAVHFTNVLFDGKALKTFDPAALTSGGYAAGAITHGEDFSITK
jgi:hypothetical protein